MRTIATTLSLLLIGVAPAMAQQDHPHTAERESAMGMMGMQHCMAMMGGTAMAPMLLLEMQDSLELTDAQVRRLEALRDRAQTEAMPHMHQAMMAQRAAAETLDADDPDLDAYEARLREAMNHMVLAHMAMARIGLESRQLLTPEQRTAAAALARRMHDGMAHGAAAGGGMMPCMMMGAHGHDGTSGMPDAHGRPDRH